MIERIFHLYPEISILIIDDNSPDHTARVVEDLMPKNPHLFILKRSGKLGLGTAYLEGFKWALMRDFEIVVQMDCDFSHDPHNVNDLVRAVALDGHDLAIGSRYSDKEIRTKDWSKRRLALSFSASYFLQRMTGMRVKDMQGGFKAFKRSTLEKINLDNVISRGYVFQFEINYKVHALGLSIVEIPIIFYQRMLGVSKMNSGIVIEALKVLAQLRLRKLKGKLN